MEWRSLNRRQNRESQRALWIRGKCCRRRKVQMMEIAVRKIEKGRKEWRTRTFLRCNALFLCVGRRNSLTSSSFLSYFGVGPCSTWERNCHAAFLEFNTTAIKMKSEFQADGR